MRLKVNLIVLNYNGQDLLEKYLPSILEASRSSRHACIVTVLDNQSSDASAAYVRENYPEARLVVALKNKVLCSYNDVVEKLDDDIVILLNNDMRLEPGFVDPLVEIFERHSDAFFAATYEDRAFPGWRWGILSADDTRTNDTGFFDTPGYAFSAGIGAFDRKKFVELGGYDELYLPGRYEDVDLCLRGWKRGWKGYYVPSSRKYHEGGTSFDRAFGWEKTQAMVYRNSLLFMVKNIRSPKYMARFLALLPVRLAVAVFQRKWFIWTGFLDFCGRLKDALRRRREIAGRDTISDEAVMKIFRAA